jgi:hypothetical protein
METIVSKVFQIAWSEMYNTAMSLYSDQRFKEAAVAMESAYKSALSQLGPDHVSVAKVAENMADVCELTQSGLGDYCLYYYGRAYDILLKVYGEENADVDRVRERYADYLLKKGHYEQGLYLFQQIIARTSKQYGADSYLLTYSLLKVLKVLISSELVIPLDALYTLTTGIKAESGLFENRQLFELITCLYLECEKKGRIDLVSGLLARYATIVEGHKGDTLYSGKMQDSLLMLGDFQMRGGHYDIAEAHFKRALEIREAEGAPAEVCRIHIFEHLVKLYHIMDRNDEAKVLAIKIATYNDKHDYYSSL